MIGFGVVKLQVNDKIIDLDKRADYSRHKFKLLEKRIRADLIEAK